MTTHHRLTPGSDIKALLLADPKHLRTEILDAPPATGAGPGEAAPSRTRPTVLILGGNGFVGLHLLAEAAEAARIGRVVAIVRPAGGLSARDRLVDAARRFGIALDLDRIEAVDGDINRPGFGLAESDHARLAEEVDIVVNAAGSTSHARSYRHYRDTAIATYLRLLDFCALGRPKSFHTLGSLGGEVYTGLADFYRIGFYHCGYSRMKWVVKHMTRSFAAQGAAVHVVMAPYVLGSRRTAYRDPALRYSFWQMVLFCARMGRVWDDENILFPIISGETLARTVLDNALSDAPKTEMYPALDVDGAAFAEAFGLERVPWPDFRRALFRRHRLTRRSIDPRRPVTSLRGAARQVAYTRGLFPSDLPRLMRSVTAAAEPDRLAVSHPDRSAELLVKCARANRILRR